MNYEVNIRPCSAGDMANLQAVIYCAIICYDKDNQQAVSRATRKGVRHMITYDVLYLLIAFGMFVIALINAKK